MRLEQETEASKLVKRNLGKILAAFAGGFLVFAAVVFVSIRYRAGLGNIRSSPVRVIRGQQPVPVTAPQALVAETADTAGDSPALSPVHTGTEAGMGSSVQDPVPKQRIRSLRAKKSKQPQPVKNDVSDERAAPRQMATGLLPKEAPAPIAKNPEPQPEPIVIPANTTVAVRLTEPLSTKEVHKGGTFHGVLSAALEGNGRMVAATGAAVAGRIIESKRAGLLGRHAVLSLELTQVTDEEGHAMPVKTTQWYATGKRGRLPTLTFRSHDETASEDADGASEAQTRGSDISVPRGSTISFRLMLPVTVR